MRTHLCFAPSERDSKTMVVSDRIDPLSHRPPKGGSETGDEIMRSLTCHWYGTLFLVPPPTATQTVELAKIIADFYLSVETKHQESSQQISNYYLLSRR